MKNAMHTGGLFMLNKTVNVIMRGILEFDSMKQNNGTYT